MKLEIDEVGNELYCFVYGSQFQGSSTSGHIQNLLRASVALAVWHRGRGPGPGQRAQRREAKAGSQPSYPPQKGSVGGKRMCVSMAPAEKPMSGAATGLRVVS